MSLYMEEIVMAKRSIFCLVIALSINIFANLSLAATIGFDYHVYTEPVLEWNMFIDKLIPVEEQLLGSPVTPGLFKQQLTSTGNLSCGVMFKEGPDFDPGSFPSTPIMMNTFLLESTYSLDQTLPEFLSAAWKILVTINGVTSTLFDRVADADLLQNGGVRQAQGVVNTIIEVPIFWVFTDFDNRWSGTASLNTDITVFAEQQGVVVPLPGAFWFLGSGLIGVAGWRRFRKG
jgi:hypothetical protein